MNPSDKKKQTHLRCERQRREAINNGYNELKELLPLSSSFVGCKTTNAAILFRAADYVKSLESSIEQNETEINKLQAQLSALEMILQQYENFSMDVQPYSAVQVKMLQSFLDMCFKPFAAHVDVSNYQNFTRSLLLFIETLNFQQPADAMLAAAYKN